MKEIGKLIKPLISIIIPVFNVERYLRDCLDSVFNQTYSEIEIITINDGSTDKSLEILKEYQYKCEKMKIISQHNTGQSAARNKGIELSKGKYIYFLDSDDYILPNTIETLVGKMEKESLDLIRFSAEPFTNSEEYRINKNKYNFEKYFKLDKLYNKEEFLKVNYKAFSASPVLYIVKKEILEKIKLKFNTFFSMYEDELFTLEIFLNISSAKYDPRPFYKRRYRKDSIMTSENNKENLMRSFNLKYEILKEMYTLKQLYKKPEEINLINERIKVINKTLIQTTNIDSEYKK